jgi:hypothetical protein
MLVQLTQLVAVRLSRVWIATRLMAEIHLLILNPQPMMNNNCRSIHGLLSLFLASNAPSLIKLKT